MAPAGQPVDRRTLHTLLRYTAFQLPELCAVCLLLWIGHVYWDVPTRLAVGLFATWLAKDVILFPFVRASYEPRDHVPGSDMLGATGRADDDLDPDGYVRVRHELWRARCIADGREVRAGEPIRVLAIDGLTLQVEPESTSGAGS